MSENGGLGAGVQKVFDILAKLCAFVLIVAYVVYAINANWTFINNDTVLNIIKYIIYYGPLIIVSLVAIEFAIRRNIVVQILIYLLLAVMIIFQFFPGTWDSIINTINP